MFYSQREEFTSKTLIFPAMFTICLGDIDAVYVLL